MEDDRTELHDLTDNFFYFGDQSWQKFYLDLLEGMKQRWEMLDRLYQQQGKQGL
jgi:hypothetical protein